MATQLLPENQNPLAGIASLLQTLGGTRTTQSSNPGDIAALQQVLGGLQGADYNAMLQSIFQQASGQIPGFQAAYGRAAGARSSNNSAVQAALERLLQQTTTGAQAQLAQQQLSNQQTQANVAANIAQATKGTQQTQRSGTDVGQAAKMLAGLQLVSKLKGFYDQESKDGGLLSFGSGANKGMSSTTAAQPMQSASAAAPVQLQSAELPALQLQDIQAPIQGLAPMEWTGGRELLPGYDFFSDMFADQANNLATDTGMDPLDALMNVTEGFGTAPIGGSDYDFFSF